jgi:hypothetical protein
MDTAVFLIRRQEILERMEARRQDAYALRAEHKSGILPWFLKAGAGFLGFANGGSGKWLLSLAGTALVPLAMHFVHKGSDVLLNRVLDAVLPASKHHSS